jgi:5-formyltetrahydrofolate cyclo-ligase
VVSKSDLRKEIRAQRRSLSLHQRSEAAYALFNLFRKTKLFRASRNIAMYLPNDGEIDLWPLIEKSWKLNKRVFLPALHRPGFDRMHFLRFNYKTRLVHNRFGIAEPSFPGSKTIRHQALDVVLMPLVAFDTNGNRLGMGGGYYDRTFAYLNTRTKWNKPKLIGTAYDFQKVDKLSNDPWDVPLDGIITPTQFFATN